MHSKFFACAAVVAFAVAELFAQAAPRGRAGGYDDEYCRSAGDMVRNGHVQVQG